MAIMKNNKSLNHTQTYTIGATSTGSPSASVVNTLNGISSGGNYFTTYTAADLFPDPDTTLLEAITKYMTEEEIDDLISKLMERETSVRKTGTKLTDVIKNLVRERHFTEDFIMKYYTYLSKEDILKLHTPDITTQEYAQLALLLMSDDEKK